MKVHADIAGLSFAAMKAMMLHEAEEHGLPVPENSDRLLLVRSEYGVFGLEDRGEGTLRLRIEAEKPSQLYILRDSLVGHIEHFLPEIAATISWSDSVDVGRQPPNFQFASVLASGQLCTEFHRLTLRLTKPELFDDHAIHFRFLIPPPAAGEHEWPVLTKNGSTVWPKGKKELHRPVYTASHQRGDEINVDVFLHDGGRAVSWAKSLGPGDDIAIIGPGGGGVPSHDGKILLAGDETAFPAIARIIASLGSATKHTAVLLSRSGARDYPMPENANLRWVSESEFASSVLKAIIPNHFVWLAAEKQQIAVLKSDPRVRDVPKLQRYIASYWVK